MFNEITKLPEYYLTRSEIEILNKIAPTIKDKFKEKDIIEFGSGDCKKISIILEHIEKNHYDTLCYIPIDISPDAVKGSADILINKYPGIKIHGIVADFLTQLEVIPKDKKKIFCFLGSTIGNLSTDKAKDFLKKLSLIMQKDDTLLLGFDMVKEKQILEEAYNDSSKITEKFNKNILNVINTHIGSDFNPDSFEHIAFYNEEQSRIEMHLRSKKDIKIICPTINDCIYIKKGEMIHTENSYKYTIDDIKDFSRHSGLEIQNIYTDKNKWFSLVQFIKK